MSESIDILNSQAMWEAASAAQAEKRALPFTAVKEQTKESSGASLVLDFSRDDQADVAALPLVARLCRALREQNLAYCHWKSNWKLERWMMGEGDLDLLVDRADAQAFASIIYSLGFKQAEPSTDRQMPGILNYYGYDGEAHRFVHLHVHYQLVLGHDLSKNYRLPIEKPYLESVDRQGLIPTPAPEFELIVFTLRMVLKYSASETMMRRIVHPSAGSVTAAVERELDYLESKAEMTKVRAILEQHLSFIDPAFFDRCMQSLRAEGGSVRRRTGVRRELKRCLKAHARRPHATDTMLKMGRRATRVVRERVLKQSSRKRLVNSGILISLVGGDGAGKTTSVNQLHGWLSKKFLVRRFHIGRPPRSPLTLAVLAALRLRNSIQGRLSHKSNADSSNGNRIQGFPGYLRLIRWVLAARDRHRVYMKARRFATNGGIAICDRYVLPQLQLMDGPNIARHVGQTPTNPFVKLLLKAETRYYSHILPPDLLIILRVDPEIAVQRKTNEQAWHVRSRSQELWEVDWRGTRANVIDAGQAIEDVTAQLRALVWNRI